MYLHLYIVVMGSPSFHATGTPAVRAEQALNSYVQTVCVSHAAGSPAFEGQWNPASNHMGITSYDEVIPAMTGKSIVILEVLATTTAATNATTAFSFTLAEEDATEDILRMSISGSTGRFEGPLKLGLGKALEYYRGTAETGAVQSLTISYIYG